MKPFSPRSVTWLAAATIVVANMQIAAAQEGPKNFVVHETPKPVPSIAFEDANGTGARIGDLNGKVVVLNIWATWCGPCRREMPALDHLQESLGGPNFAVVPVSIDRGGIETVRKFYGEIGIRNLPIYIDVSGQAIRQLGAVGLPTTLILDRSGQEVSRVVGPAEWDTPEIAEFLKPIIARRADPLQRAGAPDDHAPPGPLARGVRWLKTLLMK
jgi:thiol-disulfide isomerase/thioredoxin